MRRAMTGFYGKAGEAWCKMMHPDPMWPVKGKYICPTCQRKYPVPWETEEVPQAQQATSDPKVLPIREPGRAAA